MHTLTSLPWWLLVVLSLAFSVSVAIAFRKIVRRTQRGSGDDPVRHAGPLMPTLGALFAFLSAFVIATEWSSQSQTESLVQHVASASSRLAWASTAPGADTAAIQSSLQQELSTMVTVGWPALADRRTVDAVATEQFRSLESTVRLSAYSPSVSTPASNELLASIDELAAGRRDLAADAERSLPALLFVALGLSGVALIANAVTLTIRSDRRSTFIVGSIVVLVAIDLAILLVLAAPFRGTLTVSPAPLEHIGQELAGGWFRL